MEFRRVLFRSLVSKIRENAKTVIGVGVKNSSSDLFINNCDEFIYYDDLVRVQQPKPPRRRTATKTTTPDESPAGHGRGPTPERALELVSHTLDALRAPRGDDYAIRD